MSFTDQKPRVATKEDVKARWGGKPHGKKFGCYLCGHKFKVGDVWRWVYAGIPHNFLVCEKCDGPDVKERWQNIWKELKEKYRFWLFD